MENFAPGWIFISANWDEKRSDYTWISTRDKIDIENELSVYIKNKVWKEIKWLPRCLEKIKEKMSHSHLVFHYFPNAILWFLDTTQNVWNEKKWYAINLLN